MTFHYLIGRAHKNLQNQLFQRIVKSGKENPQKNILCIVPEQFTLQTERDLIDSQNLQGMMQIEVLSFTRLAQRIFSEVGGITRVEINELGKNMMIRKLLEEYKEDLLVYEKLTDKPGFTHTMSEMIRELKQHRIQPSELNQMISLMEEERTSGGLTKKLWDIGLIYEQLEKAYENLYWDQEDRMEALAESIEKSGFIKESEVFIHGFYEYTPQMRKVIEEIGKHAGNLTFSFIMDSAAKAEEGDLFSVPRKSLLGFQKIAAKLEIQENYMHVNEKQERPPELAYIEQNFFAYPSIPYSEKPEKITLFAGKNPQGEVEGVARKIVEMLREEGTRFRDIAVVAGDLSMYGPLVKRVFDEHGIPYFLDQKRLSMEQPPISWIRYALRTVESQFGYEDFFRFLKTGFHPLEDEEVEALENLAIETGLKGKKWKTPFTEINHEGLFAMEDNRIKLIPHFMDLEEKLKQGKTVKEKIEGLIHFMEAFTLSSRIENWLEGLKEKGNFESYSLNSQVWNQCLEIFDQMVAILGDREMNLPIFIKVLESAMEAGEVGVIPSTADQVLVGSVERSRAQEIKGLFIIGANDGLLPQIREGNPLLLDRERKMLRKQGLSLEEDSETKLFEENYNIYLLLSKPKESLWFSYSIADGEGKALRPSIFTERFASLFPHLDTLDERFEQRGKYSQVSSGKGTFSVLTEKMRDFVDGIDVPEIWWHIYRYYEKDEEWNSRVLEMKKGLFYKNQQKNLQPEIARKLYEPPLRASVSRFEGYHNCPYAHFVRYGLRPKERKTFEVENVDMGELFHESIDGFAKKTEGQGISWKNIDEAEAEKMVEQVLEDLVPDFRYGVLKSNYRYQYLTRRMKRIARKSVRTMVEQVKKGEFLPYQHELYFNGMDHDQIPFVVELKTGEKIYLEGRIDRLDLYEEGNEAYLKVMDYKSGYGDFDLSRFYHGLKIQLLLYLDAALAYEGMMRGKEVKPAGVFYFKIDDPMIQDPTDGDPDVRKREAIEKSIQDSINKELKMNGLAIKNVEILKKIDRNLSSSSDILPVGLKKDGDFYANASVASEEEFKMLIGYVRGMLKESGEEILQGKIGITPCKIAKYTPCGYCSYKGICQFDSRLEDNQYRVLKKMKDEEVYQNIQREISKGGEENA